MSLTSGVGSDAEATSEQAPEEPAAPPTSRIGRIRAWLRDAARSLVILLATLAVLGALGGITDLVLHEVRHTTNGTTKYSGVGAVDIVLDGDVSLTVLGESPGPGQSAYDATLNSVDTSTPFDDPQRTDFVIGGTLYLTERCPDSRCDAQLTLTVNQNLPVKVTAGNAVRLDSAMVELYGLTSPAQVIADPGRLVVRDTVVSGAVVGTVDCDSLVDCKAVVSVP